MTIEFRPPAVGDILDLPSAQKRLKSRDGYAVFIDPQSQQAREPISGGLLYVHEIALAYDRESPNHRVVVFEHGCGASGLPSTLPTNLNR